MWITRLSGCNAKQSRGGGRQAGRNKEEEEAWKRTGVGERGRWTSLPMSCEVVVQVGMWCGSAVVGGGECVGQGSGWGQSEGGRRGGFLEASCLQLPQSGLKVEPLGVQVDVLDFMDGRALLALLLCPDRWSSR